MRKRERKREGLRRDDEALVLLCSVLVSSCTHFSDPAVKCAVGRSGVPVEGGTVVLDVLS